MRLLIEPSDYTFYNVGDIAMLQAAITRLSKYFPNVNIQVLTDDPETLSMLCPNIEPMTTRGRKAWFADGYLFGVFARHLPGRVTKPLMKIEKHIRRYWPSLVKPIIRLSMKLRGSNVKELDEFLDAMSQADMLVVSGMGGICDSFEEYAFELLDSLDLAIRSGTPTVMFGQGMGPIQERKLRARAQTVLSKVDLICLREGRAGIPLLDALGVDLKRVLTTGDDAIEISYKNRCEQFGAGLGVNIRIGWYSLVDQQLIERIRPIIHEAAKVYNMPLVPVPISFTPGEEDFLTFLQIASGYHNVVNVQEDLSTPLKVIKQIGHCRMVLAGSYHAGVFALSQGIPTIGLANSPYYVDKFLGLAEQFGAGCEVIFLQDASWPKKLKEAIDNTLASAEQVRDQLLESAARQIDLGHFAYKRAYELIGSRESGLQKKN